MALGLGALALPPAAFWSMTPRELVAAADARLGSARSAPRRADLIALMAQYPDN
jgi:uncharacterized phage protein (TIGR02216 family)